MTLLVYLFCVATSGGGCFHDNLPVEVRGQSLDMGSILAPRGYQRQNPGRQVWQKAPLPT